MRTGISQFVIDANVILRYILRDNEALATKAKEIIDAVEAGRVRVTCHPVTIAEVVWVLSSHYKSPPHRIVENLEPIVAMAGFGVPEKSSMLAALRLYATSIPHFGDACACASAMQKCGGRLLSFDRKLSAVAGISRSESV